MKRRKGTVKNYAVTPCQLAHCAARQCTPEKQLNMKHILSDNKIHGWAKKSGKSGVYRSSL